MIKISEEKVLKDFIDLTSIDSVSFHERVMADELKARLEKLGFEVTEDNAGELLESEAGNLYAYLPGNIEDASQYEDAEGIILSGHMDTVVPGIGKKQVVHEDGLITTDGTTVLGSDDIAGVVSMLDAIEAVIEAGVPRRDIEIVLTVAEEAYVRGAKKFDTSRLRFNDIYVLDLTGPIGYAATQAPCIVRFEATVHGRSAHAGFNPELGRHALKSAAMAIAKTPMGWTGPENTFNVGPISAGKATNIVPEICTFIGEARGYDIRNSLAEIDNMRKVIAESIEEVTGEHVEFDGQVAGIEDATYESINENGVGYSVLVQIMHDSYKTDESEPVLKRYKAVCEKLGLPGEFIGTFGGSDLNIFANKGLKGAVIACGMNDVHSINEWTTIDDLVKSTEVCVELIQPR